LIILGIFTVTLKFYSLPNIWSTEPDSLSALSLEKFNGEKFVRDPDPHPERMRRIRGGHIAHIKNLVREADNVLSHFDSTREVELMALKEI